MLFVCLRSIPWFQTFYVVYFVHKVVFEFDIDVFFFYFNPRKPFLGFSKFMFYKYSTIFWKRSKFSWVSKPSADKMIQLQANT